MPRVRSSARRYAEAVFELAQETSSIEEWRESLGLMAEVFSDPDVQRFFVDPKRDLDTKRQLARRMFEGRAHPHALNFLLLLVERALTPLIPQIRDRFEDLYRQSLGIVVAQVTTAVQVDEAERQRIAAELGRLTGKTVFVETRVDPGIIGGLVARIGDKLIDGSVATSLHRLREQLT